MTIGNQEKIQQINEEIVTLENKITAEVQKGSEGNQDLLNQWQQEQKGLENLREGIEKADREQTIETKAQSEGIAFNVPGVDMTSLPHELIQLVEIIVKNDRKRIYAEEMEKMDELKDEHKDAIEDCFDQYQYEKKRATEIGEKLTSVIIERDSLQEVLDNSKQEQKKAYTELDDYKERLDNAATIIDEKDQEIQRLTSEISDMRATAAYGEKTAQKIIDVTPESVTEVQGLVDAIAKKYIASNPIGGNWHEIVAEDGSKEVVHAKDLPSIAQQESPSTDAISTEPTSNQLPATYEAAPVEGPQFPTIQAPNLGNIGLPMVVSTSGDSGESDQTPVTRSELKVILADQKAEILAEIRGAA